jgi:hypothetical protein
MQKLGTIDFARLLGFDTVAGDAEKNFDLRNETISDRLGAKIGPIEPTIAVDFRDDTMVATVLKPLA